MDDYIMMVTWFEDGMGWGGGKERKRWMGLEMGMGFIS
jgi:hypothetical protein